MAITPLSWLNRLNTENQEKEKTVALTESENYVDTLPDLQTSWLSCQRLVKY